MDYPKNLQPLIDNLSSINDLYDFLRCKSQELNLGNQNLGINLYGKLVVAGEDGFIYRFESDKAIESRIALYKYAKKIGLPEFLCREDIVEVTKFYTVSRQKKLKPITEEYLKDIVPDTINLDQLATSEQTLKISAIIRRDYEKYCNFDKIVSFFKDFHIGWFGIRNIGLDESGDIKIFDYTGDFSLTSRDKILFFREGEQVIVEYE